MKQKTYFVVCGAVFFVVAGAHLARLFTGWEVSIAGWVVPRWVSIPGVIIPGALSVWGFALAARARTTA